MTPPKRILLITQLFDPEPTAKGLVFARELIKQGFEVEVITGFPNYPGGKIYPGYRLKFLQREKIDGIRINRVWLYPSHSKSKVGRVANYGSFAITSFLFGLFGARRPDVVYAYHPPLTVGVAVALVRWFRRVPVVYDIQDMWPDTLRATGMFSNSLGLRLVSSICDWVYGQLDFLVVLSPGFKKLLVARGVEERKIGVIYNWCDEAALFGKGSHSLTGFPDAGRFRILFAGNMGRAQGLEAVLEAAESLKASEPGIVFIMLGGGVDAELLQRRSQEAGLTNVMFLPSVPMAEVGQYLRAADALLVHLRVDPIFEITIPSKTQAYLAVGKPILMAVNGDAADLVRISKSGLIAASGDAQSIARGAIALARLTNEERELMAKNGKRFYFEHLALEVGAARFGEIFSRIAVNLKPDIV